MRDEILQDIVDALEMQIGGSSSFVEVETGRVETVSDELLGLAEELGDGEPELLDWQREEWEVAKRIALTNGFRKLPAQFEIHEWAMMESFALSVESAGVRRDLANAIQGAGAFRKFKSEVRRHGVEEAWFRFRANALREVAVEWCEENGIAWR